jgi:hypothetical protein
MDVAQAKLNHLNNIATRTGKSLAELAAVVKTSGLAKHGEVVAMLKGKLKVGHGDANAIAHYAKSLDGGGAPPAAESPADATDTIYAGPKAALRPIHDALMAALKKFGKFEVAPKKGYLSLRRKKQFAMIGPGTNSRVDIGINLKDAKGTKRFVEQKQPAMCQFKVGLTDKAEVDKELVSWLKKAYDAAG